MVGRTLAAAMLALLLAGCEFFARSPFPDFLPGLQETTDLSGVLADPKTWEIDLFTLPLQDGDAVFLMQRPEGGGDSIVAVFDEELRHRETVTGWFGDLRMVDVTSALLVGNYRFDPITLEGTYDSNVDNYGNSSRSGFTNFMGATYTMSAYDYGGYSALDISRGTAGDWTGTFTFDGSYSITAPGDGRLFRIGDVFYFKEKTEDQGFAVITLIEKSGGMSWAIVARDDPGGYVDEIPFETRISDAQEGEALIERAPLFHEDTAELLYASFPLGDGVGPGGTHITADGVVVERDEKTQLVEFGTGRVLDTESVSLGDGFRQAYSVHADYYYILDIPNERLYKARTWW